MVRMIIADDEEIVRNGLHNAVDWASLGVQVVACVGDGLSLYEKAVKHQADLALVDIRMPIMDGLTAIEKIREELPRCEFVIFTAYADFSYAKRAIDLGVSGYITKPVMKQDVIDKVKVAISRLPNGHNVDNMNSAPIDRIRQYIQEHIGDKASLSDVADFMQMNPAYLSRYFKDKTGENFVDYSRHIRMERAKELLRTSSLKIYEIAERTGYQNPQHFAIAFKDETGMTPGAYRMGEDKEHEGGKSS